MTSSCDMTSVILRMMHKAQNLDCCQLSTHDFLEENFIAFNTLRLGQNGRHFPDNHLKCFFLNENIWISINTSLKFVPKGRINNIPAFVQIMAWCQLGDKPTSHYLNQWWLDYWRIYVSLGLNELSYLHCLSLNFSPSLVHFRILVILFMNQ